MCVKIDKTRRYNQPAGVKCVEAVARRNLAAWRDLRDDMAERMFLSVYGSPVLQASLGVDPADTRPMRSGGAMRGR